MSHTVITTTSTGTSGDRVLNLGYTRTIPGLLKIGQMVALLIAFLCVHLSHGWPRWAAFQYFVVVTLWFLVAFLIFFIMHLFRLQGRMPCINWPLTEFFHYSVGSVLIFIASLVAVVNSSGASALVAGAVFGFMATFLMAVNLWTSYSVACGSHHTVTPPEAEGAPLHQLAKKKNPILFREMPPRWSKHKRLERSDLHLLVWCRLVLLSNQITPREAFEGCSFLLATQRLLLTTFREMCSVGANGEKKPHEEKPPF
ncbi:uncharacterized protein V6R79_024998 [Siganus canaliculatus]